MFRVTIETSDRRVTVEDYEVGADSTMGEVIPVIRDALIGLGYHQSCVEDYIPQ